MTPLYISACFDVLHPARGRRGALICGALSDEALNLKTATQRQQITGSKHRPTGGLWLPKISSDLAQVHEWTTLAPG